MFSRDLVERVVATFVQASLGAMTSNSMFDLGVGEARYKTTICDDSDELNTSGFGSWSRIHTR